MSKLMTNQELQRELLIEKVGRAAAEMILELQDHVDEIRKYIGVVRVAHTYGWKLERNAQLGQASIDPQNSGHQPHIK